MNPFLRYLADKNSVHRHTDTQTHRQTHADDHKTIAAYGAQVNMFLVTRNIIKQMVVRHANSTGK